MGDGNESDVLSGVKPGGERSSEAGIFVGGNTATGSGEAVAVVNESVLVADRGSSARLTQVSKGGRRFGFE